MNTQQTDIALLNLAAKAIGGTYHYNNTLVTGGVPSNWNPLSDDRDALHLAAKLHIDLDWSNDSDPHGNWTVEAYRKSADGIAPAAYCYCPVHPESDYRRAIVEVAAEIGRRSE